MIDHQGLGFISPRPRASLENSLNLFDESSQSYLKQQMENYFFSEGGNVDKIEGYTPK